MDKVSDTGGKYTEFDEYNMPDVDKDKAKEIIKESGGLIDDDFIMSSFNETGEHLIFCIFIYRWIRLFFKVFACIIKRRGQERVFKKDV